jgi:hypothetical protein
MTIADQEAQWERVLTMTDYYDGPRAGIANFRGKPHAYTSPFDFWEDEYADLYELRPIDDETLRLALEDWAIWLRWEAAYHAGAATRETHPALPDDRARHDEIAPVLASRLAALQGPAIRVRADFRPTPGHEDAGGGRCMEVKWTVIE